MEAVSVTDDATFYIFCTYLQTEAVYEEPPELPPRGEDFLDVNAPSIPPRSSEVDEIEEDEGEDEGEYEELSESQPPPPPSQLSDGENDYEDLTYGLKAKAIYDYQGGMGFISKYH